MCPLSTSAISDIGAIAAQRVIARNVRFSVTGYLD
jgi:hypothetical protein